MKKKVTAKEIAFEASQQNYKMSVKITNDMLKDLKDYLMMYLVDEQLKSKIFNVPASAIKSANNNVPAMQQDCAATIIKYLVIHYGLLQPKGEDNNENDG